MIVTVKAWLHAEVNWKGELEYKLHSFGAPLNARDIPLREMSFDVIVEDMDAGKARHLALRQDLEQTKQRVQQLQAQLEE